MVHAIEAYTSKHKKNVLSDVLAREALRLLSANIRFYFCQYSIYDTISSHKDRFARMAMIENHVGECYLVPCMQEWLLPTLHVLEFMLWPILLVHIFTLLMVLQTVLCCHIYSGLK